MCDPHQLASTVAFLHLSIDQIRCHLPLTHYPPLPTHLEPVSKIGCQCIEVEVEPVTEEWEAARGQELSQGVDDHMCHVLPTGTQVEDRKSLRQGVNGQPQPEHLRMAAEACSCKVRGCSPARARKARDGGLSGSENALCSGRIQSFGQRRQDHGDVLGRGFQAIQGGVASGAESGTAGLTTECLNTLSLAMLAIPEKSHGSEHR